MDYNDHVANIEKRIRDHHPHGYTTMSADDTIREEMASHRAALKRLSQETELAKLLLRQTQERCPHSDRKRWTNNDGDGQFIVERCNVCGLQKDGGLSP